mgnify:CR=1 FL=1
MIHHEKTKIQEDGYHTDIEVTIDTSAAYGHFEICEYGDGIKYNDELIGHEEGGLWFEGQELVDYDGTYDLHDKIKEILTNLNYTL